MSAGTLLSGACGAARAAGFFFDAGFFDAGFFDFDPDFFAIAIDVLHVCRANVRTHATRGGREFPGGVVGSLAAVVGSLPGLSSSLPGLSSSLADVVGSLEGTWHSLTG